MAEAAPPMVDDDAADVIAFWIGVGGSNQNKI